MSTRDRSRPAHTGRLPLTSTTPRNGDQGQRYEASVTDGRAEFEARRAAAMPNRHRQRLSNIEDSADARQRLADNPVFAGLFSDPPTPQPTQRRATTHRRPLFSDTQGGDRDE